MLEYSFSLSASSSGFFRGGSLVLWEQQLLDRPPSWKNPPGKLCPGREGFPSLGFEPGGLINYPGRLITLAGEFSHLLSRPAPGALGIRSGSSALARPLSDRDEHQAGMSD